MVMVRDEARYTEIITILEKEKQHLVSIRNGLEDKINHLNNEIRRLTREKADLIIKS